MLARTGHFTMNQFRFPFLCPGHLSTKFLRAAIPTTVILFKLRVPSAWLRKAITPARSRMMTAGRQAVSTLVCTLIDRVEEVITVDLEISPSDMPTIMDEVWSEVLKALLQLPVTDEA